ETVLQLGGELGPARLLILRQLRQQQPRLQIGEPSRHHQVVGGDLQVERVLRRDKGEILIRQRQDRDLPEIDLLLAGQCEQQIDRPFVPIELEDELLRARGTRTRFAALSTLSRSAGEGGPSLTGSV